MTGDCVKAGKFENFANIYVLKDQKNSHDYKVQKFLFKTVNHVLHR